MQKVVRSKIFKIRLSFTEYAAIKKKAKDSGRTTSRFIRETALGKEVVNRQLTEDEKNNYRLLVGIANNLNQLSKAYNQGSRMHFELLQTLSDVQEIIKNLLKHVRED